MVRDGRDNSRAVEDAGLAGALWDRVAECVPASIEGRRAVGLNELRFYRYEAGQSFGATGMDIIAGRMGSRAF